MYDEESGFYRLSPAYDLTRTVGKFEHEMTINGAGNPTDEDILALAEDFKLNLQTCRKIMGEVKQRVGH